MVVLLHVDLPDVVVGAQDVLHCEHGGVHGVVLVVVLVHPVAPDGMHVGGVGRQPRPQDVDVGLVGVVVDGVGLGHAHHVAGLDHRRVDQAEGGQLPGAEGDQVVVGHLPQVVPLEHEVLQAQARAPVLHQVRRPGAEVLDAPQADVGRMDVDPVVGEARRLGHHQGDGQEVTVVEVIGGAGDLGGHGRVHGPHQGADGHGGDQVRHGVLGLAPVAAGHHRHRGAVAVTDLGDPDLHDHLGPARLHLLLSPLPHHPGAVLGVLELLDEGGDLGLVALGEHGVDHGVQQRQVLDPLRRPVGGDLGGRDAPDLLGVGLEEDAVEPAPEAGRHPSLQVALVARRP